MSRNGRSLDILLFTTSKNCDDRGFSCIFTRSFFHGRFGKRGTGLQRRKGISMRRERFLCLRRRYFNFRFSAMVNPRHKGAIRINKLALKGRLLVLLAWCRLAFRISFPPYSSVSYCFGKRGHRFRCWTRSETGVIYTTEGTEDKARESPVVLPPDTLPSFSILSLHRRSIFGGLIYNTLVFSPSICCTYCSGGE